MTRGGGFGPAAISHTEMVAYAQLHGFTWEPAEIVIIRALDNAYLVHATQKEGS